MSRPLATPEVDLRRVRRVARQTFGVKRFRDGQQEIITAVLEGRDVLGLLPTGAGKSLGYQLPATLLPRATVVVSPLIALMQDQLDHLRRVGVDAVKIDSTLSVRETRAAIARVEQGQARVVFVTPERLEKEDFVTALRAGGVSLFVVDEAHCISSWGHDFRPAYLALREAVRAVGRPPILALTATARPEVRADIEKQLGLSRPVVVRAGIERKNLFWEVRRTPSEERKREVLLDVLREEGNLPGAAPVRTGDNARDRGPTIVYAATIRAAEEIHRWLSSLGARVGLYHGRLGTREREEAQAAFMADEHDVMVATSAFGLGIDKPNIRAVVHFQFPDSLESYYQEAGRAGRDGLPARAVLLYRLEDKRIQTYFLGGKYPTRHESLRVLRTIEQLAGQARKRVSLARIVEQSGLSDKRVKVVSAQLAGAGIVDRSAAGVSRLRGIENEAELELLLSEYEERHADDRERLETMMRYAQATTCRAKFLRAYFGEAPGEDGGNCDNCRERERRERRERAQGAARPTLSVPAAATRELPPWLRPAGETPLEPVWAAGQLVRHHTFGRGVIRAVSAEDVTVVFAGCPEPRTVRGTYLRALPTRQTVYSALHRLVAGAKATGDNRSKRRTATKRPRQKKAVSANVSQT